MAELAATPVAHGLFERGLRREIDEELEGRRGGPFLAHEQHRDLRREQQAGASQAQLLGWGKRIDPLTEGAIADLVVVLQESHEGGGRHLTCALAARLAG